jgi:AcrR family transcriptional regulator
MGRSDAERNAQSIVEAAARLLAEDPHSGMEEIASAAGVSRVTVNRHFRTRQNLVAAVYERTLARAAEILAQSRLDEGPVAEVLGRLIQGVLGDRSLALPALVIEQGASALPPEIRAHYYDDVLGAPLLALMERGRASGELADLPAGWMVQMFGATCRAAVEAVDEGTLEPEQAARAVTRSLLRGLSA